MWWWHGGAFWPMWLMMILFFIAIIALAVWAVRQIAPRSEGANSRRILEERFARGEIDEEELERRKMALEGRKA